MRQVPDEGLQFALLCYGKASAFGWGVTVEVSGVEAVEVSKSAICGLMYHLIPSV